MWNYRCEFAEDENDALKIARQLDGDGWEVFSVTAVGDGFILFYRCEKSAFDAGPKGSHGNAGGSRGA